MEEIQIKKEILKEKLRGKSSSQIASKLDLTIQEVNKYTTALKEDIDRLNYESEFGYYLSETFFLFSQLETAAWREFEYSEDPKVRIQILSSIASFRKDAVDLRSKFITPQEEKRQALPIEKIKKLPEKIRIELSKMVIQQLENQEELDEPIPFLAPVVDNNGSHMLSSQIDSGDEDE